MRIFGVVYVCMFCSLIRRQEKSRERVGEDVTHRDRVGEDGGRDREERSYVRNGACVCVRKCLCVCASRCASTESYNSRSDLYYDSSSKCAQGIQRTIGGERDTVNFYAPILGSN